MWQITDRNDIFGLKHTSDTARLCAAILLLSSWSTRVAAQSPDQELSPGARQIMEQRRLRDETVWKPEVDAQAYERVFMDLWDELRARGHSLDVFAGVPFGRLSLPQQKDDRSLELAIVESTFEDGNQWWDRSQCGTFLADLQAAGYQLHESEWHHSEFEPAHAGEPAKSVVSFLLHATGPEERYVLRGKLNVRWTPASTPQSPRIDAVRVVDLKRWRRPGPPAFEPMNIDPRGADRPERAQPVIVYDVDSDGDSDIVLGEANVVYRNQGDGTFDRQQFLKSAVGMLVNGIIADFDHSGEPAFVCIARDYHLYRFVPNEFQQFERRGDRICDIKFDRPQAFSAGDVDGDGDLDLWVGQYMPPYVFGQMPTPYYDANDGFPDYLLLNDGTGKFHDATDEAGLSAKANRRTYSGSLVDLNGDGHLDLVVVSDFSGVDIYHNDGTGRFTDVTNEVIPERHTFGMSHSLADYDGNGLLDLYVIGMSSTTARRLTKLGLGLEDHAAIQMMRPLMGYGNRMYLDTGGSRFTIPDFNDQVARTGWSWGCSSFDFDNDGDRDIYVANGHRSGDSCQDYCTTFWRHDIYVEQSQLDPQVAELFSLTTKELYSGQISWNGYEHNKLFMNRDGTEFVDIGWLLGVALESDCRAVVSDDLDGDGRVDLLVSSYRTQGPRQESFRLKVLRNKLDTPHNWIGVRLQDSATGGSAIGALVTVELDGRTLVHRYVTGDSYTAQHAATAHFGLGDSDHTEALKVQWADGRSTTLENPEINRYHTVSTAAGK